MLLLKNGRLKNGLELFKEAGIQFKKDQERVFVLDDDFIDNPLTNMVVKPAAALRFHMTVWFL